MKRFVATFEIKSGIGSQKVFKTKKQAKAWLEKKYLEHFLFYNAWTSRIKKFTLSFRG
jgi:hypothetical protein